ncbi:protein of unknown function [Paraburkholderia kururiensis]
MECRHACHSVGFKDEANLGEKPGAIYHARSFTRHACAHHTSRVNAHAPVARQGVEKQNRKTKPNRGVTACMPTRPACRADEAARHTTDPPATRRSCAPPSRYLARQRRNDRPAETRLTAEPSSACW